MTTDTSGGDPGVKPIGIRFTSTEERAEVEEFADQFAKKGGISKSHVYREIFARGLKNARAELRQHGRLRVGNMEVSPQKDSPFAGRKAAGR